MNSPITLRQLNVFIAVARDDGVTAAGQRIGLSQAAVSQALADLEATIGYRLFDRVGRRVVLNSGGRALLVRAQDILRRVKDLDRVALETTQSLNIGASVTLGNYCLPQVLIPYMQRYPGHEVSVAIHNTRDMLEQVLRAQVEVALVEGTLSHRELAVHPWRRDSLTIIAPPGHRLAQRAVQPGDLVDESWVLREQGSGTREAFERATEPHFRIRRVALDTGGNELLKAAVRAGLGIGCISAAAVAEDVERGRLLSLEIPWLNLERTFSVVMHRTRQPEAALLDFLRHCRSQAHAPFSDLPFWRGLDQLPD